MDEVVVECPPLGGSDGRHVRPDGCDDPAQVIHSNERVLLDVAVIRLPSIENLRLNLPPAAILFEHSVLQNNDASRIVPARRTPCDTGKLWR